MQWSVICIPVNSYMIRVMGETCLPRIKLAACAAQSAAALGGDEDWPVGMGKDASDRPVVSVMPIKRL